MSNICSSTLSIHPEMSNLMFINSHIVGWNKHLQPLSFHIFALLDRIFFMDTAPVPRSSSAGALSSLVVFSSEVLHRLTGWQRLVLLLLLLYLLYVVRMVRMVSCALKSDSSARTGIYTMSHYFWLFCEHSSIHTGAGLGLGWGWGANKVHVDLHTHRHCTLIMWGTVRVEQVGWMR